MGSKYNSDAAASLKAEIKKYQGEMVEQMNRLVSCCRILNGAFSSDKSVHKYTEIVHSELSKIHTMISKLDVVAEKQIGERERIMDEYERI